MTIVNSFQIVNNSNSKGIKFHYITSYNDSVVVNNISFLQAGSNAASNFIANFGGFRRIIGVEFVLFDDGTDKSTSAESIVTLTQQRDFLMESVLQGTGGGDSQSDVTYTLTIFENGITKTFTGGVEDMSLNASPGTAGNRLFGTLNLSLGTN